MCLQDFLLSEDGEGELDNMRITTETNPIDRRILGFKTRISVKRIETTAYQGVQLIKDIRILEDTYGLPNSFSFQQEYLDYEQYFLFVDETVTSMTLSIVACLIVILIITASAQITLLVAMCVMLVDMFLAALIFYWGLTFNPLVVINIVIAIGLSVDYSAHIGHSYLTTEIPESAKHIYNTDEKIRVYKAQQALSKMGSSVFHGGFSTFLAIVTLAPSKTYIFLVFFRLWFGIILFGMSNGFMLLPVILSFCGQTESVMDPSFHDSEEEEEPLNEKSEHGIIASPSDPFAIGGSEEQRPMNIEMYQMSDHDEPKRRLPRNEGDPVMGKPIGSLVEDELNAPNNAGYDRKKSIDLL